MFRGVRRHAIFQQEEDYMMFMKILELVKEKYPFELNCYCLMTNHVHMLLKTGEDEIWKIMKMLLSRYAMEFNHLYQYDGHVFEKRYTSIIIRDPVYLLEASRYIHLNPVKANMVSDPLAYDYSSYGTYIGRKEEAFISTEDILNMWRDNPQEQYRLFVEGKLSHMEHEKRIPTILPEMTEKESLEVTKIYSISGLLPPDHDLIIKRPFHAPHHNISLNAMISILRIS